MIGKIIRAVYHEMQRHYPTFRMLVCLKEKGITRSINALINKDTNEYARKHPNQKMRDAQYYFKENKNRVEAVMNLLADDKSRAVLGGVLEYRMHKTPITKELYSENDQYFVEGVIDFADGEIFVDGGAYTGDTIQQFIDTARKKRKKIHRIVSFEPDDENWKILTKFYGKRKRIKLIKKGLSDGSKTLFFASKDAGAKIVDSVEEADTQIEVIDIDSVPECHDATWIKMDIEGAEWDAIHGAKETIIRNHPKLTICIYHSDEDMLRLAEYIHDLVPEYKLYVRHHSKREVETVLYAVME